MSTGALADSTDSFLDSALLTESPRNRARLPAALTSLIGRDLEIERLSATLRDGGIRLVTLTGLGGVGKTRLALETATHLAGEFSDGITFISLAAVQDPQLVAPTIAQALELQGEGGLPSSEQLQMALRERRMLLLLDNFEHLMAAATLVTDLLSGCPQLKVLITSRFKLHLTGEHEVPVPPLETVDPGRLPALEELASVPAVRLFVERAQAANPAFGLNAGNAADVAGICRRLDGIPLALELAATWSKLLSPPALLARLERRLYLLTGGPKDAPDRLQTMRAAIAGSYELLGPSSQQLLQQLSIFTGGCTIEAAEAVCVSSDGGTILEGIQDLVEKGLLQTTVNANGEPRLVLLETIREFGVEQLEATGSSAQLRDRHTKWFEYFAELAEPGLTGPDEPVWTRKVEADIDNFRAAIAWLRDRGDIQGALSLVTAIGMFWATPNYLIEGHTWFEELLGLAGDDIDQQVLARALFADAVNLDWQSLFPEARRRNEQALAIFRDLGDNQRVGRTLVALGINSLGRGDSKLAEAQFEEARALAAQEGDIFYLAAATNLLGRVAVQRGEWDRAIACHEEALALWRDHGYASYIVSALHSLGWALLQSGQHWRAREAYEISLGLSLEANDEYQIATHLNGFAWLAADHGQPAASVRLFAAAQAIVDRIGAPFWEWEQTLIAGKLDEVRAVLGSAGAYANAKAGRGLSLEEATELALSVVVPEPAVDDESGLTTREREVLTLLVDGASDNEIADHLFITRRTASKHVAAIIEKLGVANRTAAATAAVRRRLI